MKKILILLFLFLTMMQAEAQRITRSFNDVSLSEALRDLNNATDRYEVSFIYNELEDFRVTTNIRRLSVPDAVRQAVGFYPMRVTVSDSLITVECTHKTDRHLTGTVIDEQGQPVAYANVALLNPADSTLLSGGVSNESGVFVIPYEQAQVLARISYVGYKTVWWLCDKEDVGTIRLQPDNQTLGEVVVKGYRPIIKQEHEKTIFDIKHMPKVEALKAMDVMKFAPGVVVTANGGIYVAGKDAAVFVNDRRLSGDELPAYLSSLKASDIERIEVMQNHGGTYDASIQGGVVNIVTKRTMMGFIGSVDLYAATPRSGYYELNPTANIFFGTDKWNVYGTYTYTQGRSKQYNETTNDYLYNGTRHYSEGDFFGHTKEHTYRLGAVYNLTPRQSMGLEMNGISTAPVTDNSENTTAYSVGGQTYYGISWQTYKSYSDFYNIVGSYRWDIDSRKSFLRFLINYNNKNSKSDNGLETTYANTSDYNIRESDITLSDGNNISSTLDFRKNFVDGWSIRAGGKLLASDRNSLFTGNDNLHGTSSTTVWNYQENIYGGYLGSSKELGRWYLYGSLRIENTDIKGEANGGSKTTKNYTDWFPYLYASYSTSGKYNYSLSYTRTIYRPMFSLMNGYVNRISDVLYDKGNPDLQAELTDVLDFTVSHGRHSASLKYRHKPEAITELFEVVDGITYHTNVNFGSVSSTTLNYSYSGNIQNWWQTNLYLAGSYTRIPESYNKTHLLGGIISWNNRMSWERVGILTIGFYCTSPTIIGNSYQKGFASLDFSVERSFLKNALTIQIGVNDLLNGIKIRATNRVPTLNYDVCLKNQTRQVWCRLTYNFSTKAKTNKNSIQNDNSVKNRL